MQRSVLSFRTEYVCNLRGGKWDPSLCCREKTYQKGIAWAPRWFAARDNALGAGRRQEVMSRSDVQGKSSRGGGGHETLVREVVLAETGCCRLIKKEAAVLNLLGKRHLCVLNNTVRSGDG